MDAVRVRQSPYAVDVNQESALLVGAGRWSTHSGVKSEMIEACRTCWLARLIARNET